MSDPLVHRSATTLTLTLTLTLYLGITDIQSPLTLVALQIDNLHMVPRTIWAHFELKCMHIVAYYGTDGQDTSQIYSLQVAKKHTFKLHNATSPVCWP